jgi:hypothetical protein
MSSRKFIGFNQVVIRGGPQTEDPLQFGVASDDSNNGGVVASSTHVFGIGMVDVIFVPVTEAIGEGSGYGKDLLHISMTPTG